MVEEAKASVATEGGPEEKAKKEGVLGRKFFLSLAGFIAFSLIVIFKSDITGSQALEYLIWLIGITIGGIAFEDSVGKVFMKK